MAFLVVTFPLKFDLMNSVGGALFLCLTRDGSSFLLTLALRAFYRAFWSEKGWRMVLLIVVACTGAGLLQNGLFFRLRGDLVEILSDEERAKMLGRPRYIDNLWICLPFGVKKYQIFARRCRDRWDAGLEALKEAFGPTPNQRAQMELNVCETISIHLLSLVNTVEFLCHRDRVAQEPQDQASLGTLWEKIAKIIDQEIANASRALPILERDPRIGFGYTYGEVYDAKMVLEKIEQCRYVRDVEIPRLTSFMSFHLWQN